MIFSVSLAGHSGLDFLCKATAAPVRSKAIDFNEAHKLGRCTAIKWTARKPAGYSSLAGPKCRKGSSSNLIGQRTCTQRAFTSVSSTKALTDVQEAAVAPPVIEFDDENSDASSADVPEFRWDQHWYAVQIVDYCDPAVPHHVTVLNRPLVLWRDKDENWRCFLDECPHRKVPLSEGRIDETGCLQCSYHAWSFNGQGSCVRIPQADPDAAEAKAFQNKRACCTAFPVKIAFGLIFVWPDETTPGLAAAREPPGPPEENDPTFFYSRHMQDLPYSYEYAYENFMDPAHLPVAHHSIIGNRNMAAPIHLAVGEINASGFVGRNTKSKTPAFMANLKVVKSETRYPFFAPSFFNYETTHKREDMPDLIVSVPLYVTPATPGRSRLIVFNPLRRLPIFTFLEKIGLFHLRNMDIGTSDAVFLHLQELNMKAKEKRGSTWNKEYFLPTQSDALIASYRTWLKKYGGGGVKYGPGWDVPAPVGGSRESIMERYHAHVAQCSYCSSALAAYRKVRSVLAVVCAVALLLSGGVLGGSLVAAGTQAVSGLRIATSMAPLLLIAALTGYGVKFCNGIIQEFLYKHWDYGRLP